MILAKLKKYGQQSDASRRFKALSILGRNIREIESVKMQDQAKCYEAIYSKERRKKKEALPSSWA